MAMEKGVNLILNVKSEEKKTLETLKFVYSCFVCVCVSMCW